MASNSVDIEVRRKHLEDVGELKRGDIVCHRHTGDSYVVIDVVGDRVTAVQSITIRHPVEWDLVEVVRIGFGG